MRHPLPALKRIMSGPYDKVMESLRFLTIYSRHDDKIYGDLLSCWTGKKTVADLEIRGSNVTFRNLNFLFLASGTQLEEIVNEIFVHRIYEGFGARIAGGDVVLDCGANVGLFALYAGDKVGAAGKIVCIEAIPETYALLVDNLHRNGRSGAVEFVTLNRALSDRLERRVFIYSEERSGSATGCRERFDIAKGTTGTYRQIETECVPIDTIVFDNLKTKVDFIKVDVEGLEKSVLEGARRTIGSFRPRFAISPHFGAREIVRSLRGIRADYTIRVANNVVYAW